MSINDQREPAVYVTVEDKTYIGPSVENGRAVFGVILTDRGPDKRIVTCTSREEYQRLFGVPNIQTCSQTHYILDAAMAYTDKIYACRVTPSDAALANVMLKDTTDDLTVVIEGNFGFTTASKTVYCDDADALEKISVGDYVYSSVDNDTFSEKVVSITPTSSGGTIELESAYTGTTAIGNLVKDNVVTIIGGYTFTNNSAVVRCIEADLNFLTVGDWIYSASDTTIEARQIISLTLDASGGVITLDDVYSGTTGTANIKRFIPISPISVSSVVKPSQIEENGNFIYHFYANGSGVYYNNIIIKGVRNYEMEKMYVDSEGNPFYSYIFMDIYIYYQNKTGTLTQLEGPWTVSLIRKTPDNELIRDYLSGASFYIEDIINQNSNYVRVVTGSQVDNLINGINAEQKRLQVMLTLLKENPLGMDNIAENGISFAEGTDGTGMYDSNGVLNPSDTLYGAVAQAYAGTLESVDGSIEAMPEYVFPVYQPDYIVSGGYPVSVQYEASKLAANRQDCHHLADTGINNTNYLLDITARKQLVAWNSWNSSIYVQYRQLRDEYTGKLIWLSPVYHAIQRHLYVDNTYFIGEPVANIEKGAIGDSIKLAYTTNHTTRGDLQDVELNYTIAESDGVYFSTQLTSYKAYSALKRQHIAKFTSYVKRQLPRTLKDIVQRRASQYWLSQATTRCNNFFSKFVEGSGSDRYSLISSYSVNIDFDKSRSELNIYVSFVPILSIERINVFLTLESA